jgi:hypothetical protein
LESFCLPLDESNSTSNTARLLIVIQGVTESFEVGKGLASLKSLHGITTGEDLFLSVCKTMKELELP